MELCPGIATGTWAIVGGGHRDSNDQVADLVTKTVEQCVATCLLRMVNQTGRKVDGGIKIVLPASRANIADMTGTTLFAVSRLLSAWEKHGVVASTRQHVTVMAPHKLVLLSDAVG